MKITLLPARDLAPDMLQQVEAWRSALGREWQTPFLSTEFLREVAAVRDDTWAAWIERNGTAIGLFAFHRVAGGRVGVPLARHLSDYQGIIAAEPLGFDAKTFLSRCRIEVFDFDHLLANPFTDGAAMFAAARSPIIEVRQGYPQLVARLRGQSTSWEKVQQARRRLEREMGPIRFEAATKDPAIASSLLQWKRAQYAETGVGDVFREPWTRELFERLLELRSPGCAGACSALWAGDHLLAVHFGMRGNGVWHYWFPTYDPRWRKYGPGMLLLDCLVQEAAARGDVYLDLGKGDQAYKLAWSTAAIPVLEGSVTRGGVVTFCRQAWAGTRRALRSSPLGPLFRRLKHATRRPGSAG